MRLCLSLLQRNSEPVQEIPRNSSHWLYLGRRTGLESRARTCLTTPRVRCPSSHRHPERFWNSGQLYLGLWVYVSLL
ncbi:hypothetical protein CDEST_02688 [Colletotrichum destructivum]|uniref:Uncharacterized protein n=1 Tax=Colletotrichum destructivum TaxID=34406 RepID=A0AAX4I2T4_9PEZI|nr:hypothetical protein CDEST_02688 [Colletotrichum destructivum]